MRSGRIVAVIIGLSTNIELVDVLGWGQNIGVAQISARRDIKIAHFPTKGTMGWGQCSVNEVLVWSVIGRDIGPVLVRSLREPDLYSGSGGRYSE